VKEDESEDGRLQLLRRSSSPTACLPAKLETGIVIIIIITSVTLFTVGLPLTIQVSRTPIIAPDDTHHPRLLTGSTIPSVAIGRYHHPGEIERRRIHPLRDIENVREALPDPTVPQRRLSQKGHDTVRNQPCQLSIILESARYQQTLLNRSSTTLVPPHADPINPAETPRVSKSESVLQRNIQDVEEKRTALHDRVQSLQNNLLHETDRLLQAVAGVLARSLSVRDHHLGSLGLVGGHQLETLWDVNPRLVALDLLLPPFLINKPSLNGNTTANRYETCHRPAENHLHLLVHHALRKGGPESLWKLSSG
jgi:hypothetical protein